MPCILSTAPQGVTLHALIDSCHSGAVMGLPWDAKLQNGQFHDWVQDPRQLHKEVRGSWVGRWSWARLAHVQTDRTGQSRADHHALSRVAHNLPSSSNLNNLVLVPHGSYNFAFGSPPAEPAGLCSPVQCGTP